MHKYGFLSSIVDFVVLEERYFDGKNNRTLNIPDTQRRMK